MNAFCTHVCRCCCTTTTTITAAAANAAANATAGNVTTTTTVGMTVGLCPIWRFVGQLDACCESEACHLLLQHDVSRLRCCDSCCRCCEKLSACAMPTVEGKSSRCETIGVLWRQRSAKVRKDLQGTEVTVFCCVVHGSHLSALSGVVVVGACVRAFVGQWESECMDCGWVDESP
jgi:hypothetical protein